MFAPHVFFSVKLMKSVSAFTFSGFVSIFLEFHYGSKIVILYEISEYLTLPLKWNNNTTDFLDGLEKIE